MTRRPSLRRQLLAGILLPVLVFIAVNTAVLYRQALQAADTAYDRTLLATAKSIGELLEVGRDGDATRIRAEVPYAALEAFEADNRSRLFYRVSGPDGAMVSGFGDLPPPPRALPPQSIYAALVHFYDETYKGDAVRMAVLLQPVAGVGVQTMATVQVAETLELRQTLARTLLLDTLSRQAVLVALIALVVVVVVQRATRPVRRLSDHIVARQPGDLTPIEPDRAPRELLPLVAATNEVMARLRRLLDHQKRFVRDASHQLRTPLAVLKTQVQSAQRGDLDPPRALQEIGQTVDRATELANQMLALARVEQLRQQGGEAVVDWEPLVRGVALDLAPLAGERGLDFSLDARAAPVRGHAWALRELARNLLHNAVKHSPRGAALDVRLRRDGGWAVLEVSDQGRGIDDRLRERLFEPFAHGSEQLAAGSGLGLAICREIVDAAGGRIDLVNRTTGGRTTGLLATVRLPLADNPAG